MQYYMRALCLLHTHTHTHTRRPGHVFTNPLYKKEGMVSLVLCLGIHIKSRCIPYTSEVTSGYLRSVYRSLPTEMARFVLRQAELSVAIKDRYVEWSCLQ